MAGVPSIMQAMLDNVAPTLKTGTKMLSVNVDASGFPEGAYATPLSALQKNHPGIIIGSYPHFDGKSFTNQIVLRGREPDALERARADVEALFAELRAAKN